MHDHTKLTQDRIGHLKERLEREITEEICPLQVPAWQVLPPSQSPSERQPWLSLMQVLWSSGLGMKPCRH